MRPNTYTDARYAAQRLRNLEDGCDSNPLLGFAFMSGYFTALGLFLYWMFA